MRIKSYSAPAMIAWQLTRDCDLACLHCCTDSAPGRALPDELSREEALGLAAQIVAAEIPYVLVAGGEPTLAPHFFELVESLGRGGTYLKIETNGQRFDEEAARRLAKLPIRSIQVSIDGATQEVYSKMRPGASLEKAAHAARLVRRLGMGLEVTFAPTRLNLHEAGAVIDLAASLGAFRFNTGQLMRVGTAAKLWDRLSPSPRDYEAFLALLESKEREFAGRMELCYRPFTLEADSLASLSEPPATLLILPNGKVKVSAALPFICADLKRVALPEAWASYVRAWGEPRVREAFQRLAEEPERLAGANRWEPLLPATLVGPA